MVDTKNRAAQYLFTIMLTFLVLGGIIYYVKKPALFAPTIPCSWYRADMQIEGKNIYICHGVFNITEPYKTYEFILNLAGKKDITDAWIKFYDVSKPVVYVYKTYSVPPNETIRIQIKIPDDAYNIQIWGEIIGKPKDSDYPDNPYIKGGNYDLFCGIDCKYNKDIIIDKPGIYTLEIYGGKGGNGIDVVIKGAYTLPYPNVTVYVNQKKITEFTVTSDKIVYIKDYLNKTNTIVLDVRGHPNFKVEIHAEQKCIALASDWECMFIKEDGKTKAICKKIIKSYCDFTGVKGHIPSADVPYYEDSYNWEVTIGGKVIYTGNKTAEIIVKDLSEGTYTLQLVYYLPYVIPEAKEVYGACVLDKTSIVISGEPGQHAETTFTICNFGNESLLVKIKVPEDFKVPIYEAGLLNREYYIIVQPSVETLNPDECKTFILDAVLPLERKVIQGKLYIEGCDAYLTVKLDSTGKIAALWKKTPYLVIMFVILASLLLLKNQLTARIGKIYYVLLAIVIILIIIFIALPIF